MLLAVAFLAPIAVIVVYSVFRYVGAGVFEPAFVGDHYKAVLTDPFYRSIFVKTLAMGVMVVAITLLAGFPLAFTIVRGRRALRIALTVLVLLPLMTSAVVRSYGWTLMYSDSGAIMQGVNAVAGTFGLPHIRLQFTYVGTAIALAEVLMPLMVFSLSGALQQVDPDLEEASRSLGSGRVRAFRDVTLPLAAPGIFAGCLLVFVLSISSFPTPQLVGGAQTQVISTLIYSQTMTTLNWPLASAMSLTLVVLVLALIGLNGLLMRKNGGPQR